MPKLPLIGAAAVVEPIHDGAVAVRLHLEHGHLFFVPSTKRAPPQNALADEELGFAWRAHQPNNSSHSVGVMPVLMNSRWSGVMFGIAS